MDDLVKLARRNPWAIVGLAAIAGWVAGAGALPFRLPFGGGAPAAPSTPAPSAPSGPTSGAPSQTATIASSSAAMPASSSDATDPFMGYGI